MHIQHCSRRQNPKVSIQADSGCSGRVQAEGMNDMSFSIRGRHTDYQLLKADCAQYHESLKSRSPLSSEPAIGKSQSSLHIPSMGSSQRGHLHVASLWSKRTPRGFWSPFQNLRACAASAAAATGCARRSGILVQTCRNTAVSPQPGKDLSNRSVKLLLGVYSS